MSRNSRFFAFDQNGVVEIGNFSQDVCISISMLGSSLDMARNIFMYSCTKVGNIYSICNLNVNMYLMGK